MAIVRTDLREKSEEAMRKLLGVAQNIKQSGGGTFNNEDIVNALAYYVAWRNKKVIVPIFLLALTPILLFYNPIWGFFAVFVAFFLKEMQESSRAKKRYVEEMVGNWAGIDNPEYYKKGLVLELWKNIVKKDDYTLKFNTKAYYLGVSVVAILAVAFFFSPDLILKKVILIVAFLTSEFLLVKDFIDEPKA